MNCPNCLEIRGTSLQHENEDCPIRELITCRKCCQTGHMTHKCEEKWDHWERPTTLEELIPFHIRQRYRITSATPIKFEQPRSEQTFHEIHSINEFQMPEGYKDLRAFVDKYGIIVKSKTKAKEVDCVNAIKEWAKEKGRRIIPKNTKVL